MPTYLFRCPTCDHETESSLRHPAPSCPYGGAGEPMRRVFTAPNLSAAARGKKLPIHHGRQE